jgi:hypothetical protein
VCGHGWLNCAVLIKSAVKLVIGDLSPGGVGLRHGGAMEVGQDAEVDLPEADGPVTGRVIRVERGIVSIALCNPRWQSV